MATAKSCEIVRFRGKEAETKPVSLRTEMDCKATAGGDDLTQLSQTRADMERHVQLADLGTRAARIAHKIRNPLVDLKLHLYTPDYPCRMTSAATKMGTC